MKIGAIVPQGWVGEYDGWDPLDAWRRTRRGRPPGRPARVRIDLAVRPLPHGPAARPMRSPSSCSRSLAALAALTERVRLGHVVICTAFRNPALTAKMISTMDSSAAAGWSSASAPAGSATSGSPTAMASPRRPSGWRGSVTTSGSSPRCSPATSTSTRPTKAGTRHVREREQRPQADPAAARSDHGRWQRAERHLAAGGTVRRRAQPRRDEAAEVVAALPVIAQRCEEIDRDPATPPGLGPRLGRGDGQAGARLGSTAWPAIARPVSAG